MTPKTDITSRKISFEILHAILNQGSLAHELFTAQSAWGELPARDRAFVRVLVMSCVRQYGQLTICIDSFVKRPPKPRIRTIILLGAAQLLILKTEPHAAIHTSVSLARALAGDAYTGLVNGVLRTISRSGENLFQATNPSDNLPKFFKQDWSKNWGEFAVQQIMRLAQSQAPLDITLKNTSNTDVDFISDWTEKLSAKSLSAHSVRCEPVADVTQLPGYHEGQWWVQDCTAALPARLWEMLAIKTLLIYAQPLAEKLRNLFLLARMSQQ
jgi:16S rRNA (cytosine967-C5)-methyltransferase